MTTRCGPSLLIAPSLALFLVASQARASEQGAGAGKYQVVNARSLLSLAEVKRLVPWASHLDAFAEAQEEPLGSHGSACEYSAVRVQGMAFNRGTIDTLRKSGPLEPVPGVWDEAYVRNNRGFYAEMAVKVGPHLLTVQLSIHRYKRSRPPVRRRLPTRQSGWHCHKTTAAAEMGISINTVSSI